METRREKAERLFKEGYNCSQAVFGAFHDLYGIDVETALKLSSSFGGGMGRMREVCGAVSGMFMVAGLETGTADGNDREGKKHNYDVVQSLANEFRKKNSSIICRELLGLDKEGTEIDISNTNPAKRTKEYYQKRPCIELVKDAVDIIENELLHKKQKAEEARIQFSRVQSEEDIKELARIADEVWHQHFITILSPEQIDYMVDKFQSEHAMKKQMETEGYEYYFLVEDGKNVGYTGFREDGEKLFLSKLYILKDYRGKGHASEAFAFLEAICKERALTAIWLTVNRYNDNTIAIYKKKGFEIIRTQIADIGNGYVMDDYIMEKEIKF